MTKTSLKEVALSKTFFLFLSKVEEPKKEEREREDDDDDDVEDKNNIF